MDLLDLLVEIEAGSIVAPPRFTTEVYEPRELARAWEAWVDEHGVIGSFRWCHLWRADPLGVQRQEEASGHAYQPLRASLTCGIDEHARAADPCQCVGVDVVRAWCAPCGWASRIVTDDRAAVAAWHDHAWPGWRDLPVLAEPGSFEGKKAERWAATVEATYPVHWARPGAPVVSRRAPMATRDVPSRSPWGGFDLAEVTTSA